MRDAFGGAFSIKLMLIFLILYVSFICVALNYARAFRVKNRIINIVEQYEGYCGSASTITKIESEINSYLNSTGYYIEESAVKKVKGDCLNDMSKGRGYCVYSSLNTSDNSCTTRNIYTVETYMIFTIPIINVHFPIVIKGETRPVEQIS